MKYCQAPCAAVAGLATTATPARLSPSMSWNSPPNRLATVAPVGFAASSATAAKVAEPVKVGASLVGVTSMLSVMKAL